MPLESTGLFLTQDQVHLGMTVALSLEGSSVPLEQGGRPLILKYLMGGIPPHPRFYPVDSIVWTPAGAPGPLEKMLPLPAECRPTGSLSATAIENFRPDCRFMPLHTFSTANIPANTECLVFVNNDRLRYGDKKGAQYTVRVYKNDCGEIISTEGEEYGVRFRPFALPEGAVLIPRDEIGAYHP
jgi:hypothetical protein